MRGFLLVAIACVALVFAMALAAWNLGLMASLGFPPVPMGEKALGTWIVAVIALGLAYYCIEKFAEG